MFLLFNRHKETVFYFLNNNEFFLIGLDQEIPRKRLVKKRIMTGAIRTFQYDFTWFVVVVVISS